MTNENGPSFSVDIDGDGEANALDEVSNELERERDARKEERFLLVLALIVLGDALVFSHMASWSGPIVIGVLELVGLAVLARKWGVQEVAQFLAMFFQHLADRSKFSSESKRPDASPDAP